MYLIEIKYIDDIEMSDDEDGFSDVKGKCVIAKCVYDKNLNRWIPLKFYNSKKRLSTISNIKYTERLMNGSRII